VLGKKKPTLTDDYIFVISAINSFSLPLSHSFITFSFWPGNSFQYTIVRRPK